MVQLNYSDGLFWICWRKRWVRDCFEAAHFKSTKINSSKDDLKMHGVCFPCTVQLEFCAPGMFSESISGGIWKTTSDYLNTQRYFFVVCKQSCTYQQWQFLLSALAVKVTAKYWMRKDLTRSLLVRRLNAVYLGLEFGARFVGMFHKLSCTEHCSFQLCCF